MVILILFTFNNILKYYERNFEILKILRDKIILKACNYNIIYIVMRILSNRPEYSPPPCSVAGRRRALPINCLLYTSRCV